MTDSPCQPPKEAPRIQSIAYRLFWVFLVLIFLPFGLYTGIIMYQSSREARNFATQSASQVLEQSAVFVENRLDSVKRALDLMSISGAATEVFAGDPARYEGNLGKWMVDAANLQRITWSIGQNNPDIRTFTLYSLAGITGFSQNRDLQLMRNLEMNPWYLSWMADRKAFKWVSGRNFSPGIEERIIRGNEDLVYGFRKLSDDLDLRKTIGIMRVDLPVSIMTAILDKAELSPNTALVLLDTRREVITASRNARRLPRVLSSMILAKPGLIPRAQGAPNPGMNLGSSDFIRTKEFAGLGVSCRAIKGTDWQLLMVLPLSDMDLFAKDTRSAMVIALVVLGGLMLPLSWLVLRTSTRRIASLTLGVRRISQGDLDIELPEAGRDEISDLTRNFNAMTRRLKDHLDQEYRMGKEIKNLEMLALQAQINPHFLYNTLDLINCLAIQAGVAPISEAVGALSKFYRLSLGGGAETVPLRDELEHVKAYLKIQNMRFDQSIILETDLQEELLARKIHKIMLQPLVENAVLHGIRELERSHGTISIRASEADVWITMEVADDGIGADLEKVAPLLEGPPEQGSSHGFGISNLQRRLKVCYGPQAGLEFRSEAGKGTVVTVRFPAQA